MTRTEAAIIAEALRLLTPYQAGYDRTDVGEHTYEVVVTGMGPYSPLQGRRGWQTLQTFDEVRAFIVGAVGDTSLGYLVGRSLERSEAAILAEAIMILTPYRASVTLPEFGEDTPATWDYDILIEQNTSIPVNSVTVTVFSLGSAPEVAYFIAEHTRKDKYNIPEGNGE